MSDRRIAAIDIGSNSIRQIVADVSPDGEIRIVDEMKAAPRLWAGVAATGRLGDTHMDAAVEALVRMAELAKQLGAVRTEVVATSAVREAANGGAFLARVRREAGLKPRVLEGEEEARLAFRSALAHFEMGSGRWIVADIGGGSLELALSAEGLVERLVSLPFGAVRLTEEFLSGKSNGKGLKRLRRRVRDGLRDVIPLRDWRGAEVIGSGGTFTNLAGMHLARQGTRAATVHGTHIPRHEVEHILEMLAELDADERATVEGLNAARADIIVAGLAVTAEILARVEPRELTASAYGIREGLLLEAARVRPVIADPGEARDRSVLAFAERCHYEAPHARQVQALALQLFDALGARIGCDPDERRTLGDAALLHDVGYHINYEDHHKHSFHLIRHADLLGIPPEEQLEIALIARYHRGKPPRHRHKEWAALDREARERVRRLGALLRVADGLDRGHVGAVERVKVRWLARCIRLAPVPRRANGKLRLEVWGANRKSALLADVAGMPIEIVAPSGEVLSSSESDA